ncbi:MAG TPA: peptidoglycan-associated lipoprotein Pal [Gallionellaceae bacterium]|nr:peptidoglycan-associated lipoprotein Pal [Gallionellaceae bacterium]
MKKLILGLVLANLLVACASEPIEEETQAPTAATEPAATEPAAAPAETATAAPAPEATEAAAPVVEAAAMPTETSVHFPFDVDAVQAEDRATVQALGKYLSENRASKVRLEGNADERGSSEYNLALGQRRANNVKKLLVLSGAAESQVTTVSYGEEKPRATGHDEASWAENRRVDFVAK